MAYVGWLNWWYFAVESILTSKERNAARSVITIKTKSRDEHFVNIFSAYLKFSLEKSAILRYKKKNNNEQVKAKFFEICW